MGIAYQFAKQLYSGREQRGQPVHVMVRLLKLQHRRNLDLALDAQNSASQTIRDSAFDKLDSELHREEHPVRTTNDRRLPHTYT